jgi:hypothetical protein
MGSSALAAAADTCASQHRLTAYDIEDACWRARVRSAVPTPPPTPLPTLVPTLLGGTARAPSCMCAPSGSVRARATPRCRRVVCLLCDGPQPCVRACVRACVPVRAWVCLRLCVRALPWHGGGPAVFIARHAGGHVCALHLSPRSGRRCVVGEPHVDRAVGCAIWAHDGGRRRRRHLRHRRPQRHHFLQRRVGEHRRRCAGWTRAGGGGGYWGYSGCSRGTWVYQGVCGVLGVLEG